MKQEIIRDRDFALYQGDCRELVRELPRGKIDCVVTSPPYYGLRDYGTGSWSGGSKTCNHTGAKKKTRFDYRLTSSPIQDGARTGTDAAAGMWDRRCPDCGAVRVDLQIGLEDNPRDYVDSLVSLFGDIRQALAPHAVVWVNLGDSYEKGTLRGVPWRFALQMGRNNYRLVRDVIWYKRDPMPESVKHRPTTTHEYLFMFTLTDKHYYDWWAVREDATWTEDKRFGKGRIHYGGKYNGDETGVTSFAQVGEKRLLRSVWDITTVSYPDAHFATFPPRLPERCILAGCPPRVCNVCGEPQRRVVHDRPDPQEPGSGQRYNEAISTEWTDCGHGSFRRGTVLDPFLGSGTTAFVARKLGRNSVGFELNKDYCDLIRARTAQLDLVSEQEVIL